jgi:hypothetical protein
MIDYRVSDRFPTFTHIDVFLEALGVVRIKCRQDGSLGTSFWDILVLQVLRRGQGVILVEKRSDVGVVVLLASRSDDSNTTSSDVSESDVESSELGADDEEHSEGLLGVLDLRQETWVESERQSDLCWLVEVALEDVLVENQ